VPSAPESYVHRIGRVGRAGREGVAITLAEPREHRLLKNIERLIKQQIPVEQVPDRRRPSGVPEHTVDEVIGALQNAKVKGKRANVRRYVDDPR
jgi:superfamily II DNA/RNA helicase